VLLSTLADYHPSEVTWVQPGRLLDRPGQAMSGETRKGDHRTGLFDHPIAGSSRLSAWLLRGPAGKGKDGRPGSTTTTTTTKMTTGEMNDSLILTLT
jgi:hypothetical protein